MTCTRWSTSPFFHSCARQEVDTALRVCSGQIDGANNLSRTLEHARSNAAAELPQWRNQLERTACELAGGPSDPPFVHDLPLWRNQLERTSCQANPRHGSSSPLASLLEQIHPLHAAAAAHGNQSPAAPRILHCLQGLLICIWRVLMKLNRQHSYLLVLNLTNCIVKLCKTGIDAKV